MSTKALAIFFVFLTILNLPVMLFYSKGNPAYSDAQLIDSFFATLSLGNVGQKNEMCASENLATFANNDIDNYSPMKLQCNSGTLGDIIHFGFGAKITSNCGVLIGEHRNPEANLLETCRNNGTEFPIYDDGAYILPSPEVVKNYTGNETLLTCY